MASTTASSSPALISWPSFGGEFDTSSPGMGDRRNLDRSGGHLLQHMAIKFSSPRRTDSNVNLGAAAEQAQARAVFFLLERNILCHSHGGAQPVAGRVSSRSGHFVIMCLRRLRSNPPSTRTHRQRRLLTIDDGNPVFGNPAFMTGYLSGQQLAARSIRSCS